MSAALLPCPFCGGAVQLEKSHKTRHEIYGERQWWGVRCTNNVNVGGTCAVEAIPTASPEAAIGRWNRRAPAIAPPVAAGSVDGPVDFNFDRYHVYIGGPRLDKSGAYVEYADAIAWGAQQREAGRQEVIGMQSEFLKKLHAADERAEKAEKQWDSWMACANHCQWRAEKAEARVKELDQVLEAAEVCMEVLDGYHEKLVPINRNSISVNALRRSIATLRK